MRRRQEFHLRSKTQVLNPHALGRALDLKSSAIPDYATPAYKSLNTSILYDYLPGKGI